MGFAFQTDAIKEFKDDYRFLSNFWRVTYTVPVMFEGKTHYIEFKSSEHAYQAFKANNRKEFDYIRAAETPGKAKRRGREITIRQDWDTIKLNVMMLVVSHKFEIPRLGGQLIYTWPRQLVEGNWWNDQFWGVCLKTNIGTNALGQILMKVRKDIMDAASENKAKRETQALLKRKY